MKKPIRAFSQTYPDSLSEAHRKLSATEIRMPSTSPRLTDLENSDEFLSRHIGPGDADRREMLAAFGLQSMEDLVDKVLPASIRLSGAMALGEGLSEDSLAGAGLLESRLRVDGWAPGEISFTADAALDGHFLEVSRMTVFQNGR